MEKFQKRVSMVIAVIVLIVVLFIALIGFISDYLWFKEMGYTDAFFKQLITRCIVGFPTFIIITGLVFLYLNLLRKSYFSRIDSSEEVDMKKLKKTTGLLALAFGAITAWISVGQLWFEILKFTNSTNFNLADPIFNLDVGFYIFKLEFLSQLNDLLIGVIVGFVALTVIYYIILMTVRTPDMFTEKPQPATEETASSEEDDERYTGGQGSFGGAAGGEAKDPFAKFVESLVGGNFQRRQPKPKKQFDDNNFKQLMSIAAGKISILGFIFFIMLAVDFFLKQFDILHSHNGVVFGAGFTDSNITLWMLRILCGLSVIAAIMFVIHMRKKNYKKLLTIPVIMIVVGIVGTLGGSLVQNFIVSPDEIDKETPYLERNIQYTQHAYQLDNVDVRSFAADNTLKAADINNNLETINNIRINDFDPAQQFYNQTQSIRQYYSFYDVDVDRYVIDGELTQTFLTAREIDETKIDDSWLNRHLKYTHGYGAALSRVDKVTASGQPDVLMGNIPPQSSVNEIQLTRPEIYFGELSNEYIIVNTDEKEFDYPDGDKNQYTTYEGTAGIKMNFLNRIIFSIREGSLKLLVSNNISSDSRIIINRNVMERVSRIMPYISYENDPYLVTSEGKLYWMIDAYTESSLYPYSEPFDGQSNYIRNSIKVVVDAYNGDVNYYIVDETDPIAQTFSKIYPDMFKPFSEMPEGLQAHIRYPNYLFQIQANVYAKYHMEDVSVFYQKEDQWSIASEIYGMEKRVLTPNYYIAKLPGEAKAEFFSSIPFTPGSKQNMTALMVARNDGDAYGQLVLYQFPKGRTIYGPEQIEAQIDQNTEISRDFSLWNSSGTKYRRGNMFVIPINTSILYVEPVYLEAQNSSIPEVKRIIVAYNDKIAYKETLAECLAELFGESAQEGVTGEDEKPVTADDPQNPDEGQQGTTDVPTGTLTQSELITRAADALQKAQEAQKNGDWAGYGKYLKELEECLTELEKNN